jgi:hypothetical protein
MENYNFNTFLTDYKTKALLVNLAKEYPLVYEILEKQKLKLNSADFDEDIEEVIEFCKKAIKKTKESLIISFSNKHYKSKFENGNPPFLSQMKTYIECGNLYEEAISKKNNNQLFESDRVIKNKKIEIHDQKMDYIEIILRGYTDENNRNFLSKYFIRESKKAEKENYSFEEFFAGLDNAIIKFKIEYKNRLFKRKNELYFMLDGAKNGTLTYANTEKKSIEELHSQTIEYCESELSEISFENFPLNLFYFTSNRYTGHLNYSEVEFICNEIAKAFKELEKPEQTDPLNFYDPSTIDKNVNFKNAFDKVDERIVFEYFKKNLVGKKYLSEKVLNNFLSLAFDQKVLPTQKFSFEKLNTQSDIVQIFYNYYKITAGKPYGKQKEYLNLLCNYFNGFENFNIKNFSK